MDELRRAKVPYTQVANVVLYDGRLSFKAKGLYAYLYAKPNGWHFSAKRIAEEAADGRKAVLSALQELEAHGYLERKKQADGRVVYHLSHTIAKVLKGDLGTQEPKSPNGTVPKGHGAERAPIIKKELDKERDITNREMAEHGSAEAVVVIDAFSTVNPVYAQWYKNTTQREAACKRRRENPSRRRADGPAAGAA